MAETVDASPIPPVEERLSQLRPSRELLEYYRQKIAEFDAEHEEMLKRLDAYRCTYEEQHKVQHTIRQREHEITELQRALSDMQVFLFQEREQVLRLHAENDRLRLRELEDRQRIQHLLTLTEPTGHASADVTYLQPMKHGGKVVKKLEKCRAERNPHHPIQHANGNPDQIGNKVSGAHSQLALTVQSLQAQLEEQTRLAKQQIDALLQDRQVSIEENQARADRDSEAISSCSERLQKTQDLLYDSTRDFLALKYELRARERGWVTEKDELMCKMDEMKRIAEESSAASALLAPGRPSTTGGHDLLPGATDMRTAYKMELQRLREALQQQQQLAESYRDQCTELEDLHSQLREKQDSSQQSFSQRAERMAQRLALMNDRYKNLEKRRSMEKEGFHTDIKALRNRLKDLEKQLYKVTVNFDGANDMDVLQAVKQTTGHTKHLVSELHHLKTKVYGVESELRRT